MKILICGLGSIGLRHTKNLLKLGYEDILLFTSRKVIEKRLKNLKKFNSLANALQEKPNLVLVCNSTHLHEDIIITCLKKNINIFIEKPVGFNKKKLEKISELIKKKPNINNMVGYMMRFHPAIIRIKQLLKSNEIGEVFHFSSCWGEYLPNWHKNENYRNSYASNKSMGGGVSLTLSHDLDLSFYLFDKIKKVEIIKNNINSLKINAESSVDFLVSFKKNINGFIHLDYLQKKPVRNLIITGTEGSIEFNYYKNKIQINKNNKQKKILFKQFKRNHLFINEMKYVLESIKSKKKMRPNIVESINLLKSFKLL
jgi:predicted dehydrogenase